MLESEEKWLKKIRTNMEELLPENETAEIDIFGVDVGEYIRAKLPDAIARVFITAPVHLLEGKECKDVLFPEKLLVLFESVAVCLDCDVYAESADEAPAFCLLYIFSSVGVESAFF